MKKTKTFLILAAFLVIAGLGSNAMADNHFGNGGLTLQKAGTPVLQRTPSCQQIADISYLLCSQQAEANASTQYGQALEINISCAMEKMSIYDRCISDSLDASDSNDDSEPPAFSAPR